MYDVKVEKLSEKLTSTVGDSDIEYTILLFTENETVCYQAVKCISRLKQFEEAISMKMVKTEEAKKNMIGKRLTFWLLFVMFIVILLLSHLVSQDKCGT